MINQRGKYLVMLDAASETNGGTLTSNKLDTKGFKKARIVVWSSTAATNKIPTTLKLSEADDTTTTMTDIVAFTGGTSVVAGSTGFVIPTPEGTQSDSTYKPFMVFDADLRGRKRYLTLTIVPITTQTYYALAELTRGEEMPNTTTEANIRGYAEG
jgi:hypothetical protein